MRAARALSLVALAAGALAACSLLTETSDLAGAGRDAESSPESATPDVDGSDAAIVDSGPVAEGSTNADAAPDALGCGADFCDSFDQGEVGDDWDKVEIYGGTLAHDPNIAVSLPSSLHATVQSATSLTTRTAFLVRALPLAKGARCEFSIFVTGNTEPVHHVDLFQIKASAGDVEGYSLRLFLRGAGTSIREDLSLVDGGCNCPRASVNFVALPRDEWVKVSFETDFKEASVKFDGAIVHKGAWGNLTPASLGVAIGLGTYDMGAYDVRYDDLRCWLIP